MFSHPRTVNCEIVKIVNGVCGWGCACTRMCTPLFGRKKESDFLLRGIHCRFMLGTFEETSDLDFDLSSQVGRRGVFSRC